MRVPPCGRLPRPWPESRGWCTPMPKAACRCWRPCIGKRMWMVAGIPAERAPRVAVAPAGRRRRRRGESTALARPQAYPQALLTQRTPSLASFAWRWGKRPRRPSARSTLTLLSLHECRRGTPPPPCGCLKRHPWSWSSAVCTCPAKVGRQGRAATTAPASADCRWAAWRRRLRPRTCLFGRLTFLDLASRDAVPAVALPAGPWHRRRRRWPLLAGRGGSRHHRRRPQPPLPPPRRPAKSVSGPSQTTNASHRPHNCHHRPPSRRRLSGLRPAASKRRLLWLQGCYLPALGPAAAAPRQGVNTRTSASQP